MTEAPIVVENREELIFLLSEASELEHMVMLVYLFAAFSLKTDASEGLTEEQLEAVKRWERVILEVAAQEMLHLASASNLLTSIGGAPHFSRPNFPQPANTIHRDSSWLSCLSASRPWDTSLRILQNTNGSELLFRARLSEGRTPRLKVMRA